MKILGKLLALCVFHPNVWEATAFIVRSTKPAGTGSQSTESLVPSEYSGSLGSSPNFQEASLSSSQNGAWASVDDNRSRSMPSRSVAPRRPSGDGNPAAKIWGATAPVTVQGGSLKTWTFASPIVERVQVALRTEGRPLDADIDLWQGPDNTPTKMRVYIEDGSKRPFSATIETPRGPNTIAIRNTAHLEFPLSAAVVADTSGDPLATIDFSEGHSSSRTIQGGALRTYPFDSNVQSVQILLRTDGRPLNARIELLQGPNNKKQVIDLYTEDGMDRPFFAVIETPGAGNVVRIVNTATVEFPMTAWVEPYMVGDDESLMEPVLGGDSSAGFMKDRQWDRE